MSTNGKSVNSTATDVESGCIANNLPLKVMRIAMENKGIFDGAKPGALYCFTGEYNTVTVDGITYTIPQTIKVEGPSTTPNVATTYKIKLTGDGTKISSAELIPG